MVGTLLVQAARALVRHKVRSALNALGIAIGIAAVVWVVAIGQAGAAQAKAQMTALGDNLVWVEAGSRNINGLRSGTFGMHDLMLDDATAILRDVPTIKRVSPNIDGRVVVQWRTKNWTTQYRGVSPDYDDIKRWDVALGDGFTDQDVDRATNVVLLGETVREQLFGPIDPRGEIIRLNAEPITVVGVLAAKGQSSTGRDQDDEVHMPFTTVIKRVRGGGQWWLDDILCSATSARDVPAAVEAITTLMRQRHHIAPEQEDDFNIRHPEELIAAQIQAADTLDTLLVSIAAARALALAIFGYMPARRASRLDPIAALREE